MNATECFLILNVTLMTDKAVVAAAVFFIFSFPNRHYTKTSSYDYTLSYD